MKHSDLQVLNNPGGLYSVVSIKETPGDLLFVQSVHAAASDTNSGRKLNAPLATLDAAFGDNCTENEGTTIYVMPGHAETFAATGAHVVADKAGVNVIGIGNGADRPTFTYSHTGATTTWSANGLNLANLLFVTAIDQVTTFGTVSGADVTFADCETRDTTDVEVVSAFTCTGARLTVLRHLHNGYTGGNANARVFSLNGVAGALFKLCRFLTKVTTAVINFVSTACTGVVVQGCTFLVSGTSDFSKNIVDTVTGSVWSAQGCFDIGAGSAFSGGSGSALATDAVGAAVDSVGTQVDSMAASLATHLSTLQSLIVG